MLDAKPALAPGRGISVSDEPRRTVRANGPAPPQARSNRTTPLMLSALLVFIVVTRWLVVPRYLYYFDSANFALSLEHFNPALHQPQPPGYPLFVALLRLIHIVVPAPETVMLIAGIIGA